MKRYGFFFVLILWGVHVYAQQMLVTSPDSRLNVHITIENGIPIYGIKYDGKVMLEDSPLGFVADIGDYTKKMSFVEKKTNKINETYIQNRIKSSLINYAANELIITMKNVDAKPIDIVFRVSNNDVAFRYEIPKFDETGSIVIYKETTGFNFPSYSTTFLSPQSDAMIGWKRTKPSYEEEYTVDSPIGACSKYNHGYTFPGLFRIGDDGWVLISETGVDSKYCASHLSDATSDGLFTIVFPMREENNGNGTTSPGFALPGVTPWRTITVGTSLKPIVETTICWDVVSPLYETIHEYQFGRSTWSWILWQDESINYWDQIRYIDFAAAMGFEFTLIDSGWDRTIGYEKMKEIARYARSKNVSLFLWYSSSGYWNDIVQSPVNKMDNSIIRKREMKWLHDIGIKGIKVDFFGGDKQETIRLYEEILSDADDYGLMVIFHGCTLPRGWERMYPNYVGSEAVLASENHIFKQYFCDNEAFNACLHPFIRNTVGSMDFGGTFLNKRYNRTNDGGTIRRTSDVFQLATAILFQNPIQNFALAPNNLIGAPIVAIEFMKQVPSTWDETLFIDGYPGKYVVLARRHADKWYIAGVNAMDQDLDLMLDLSMLGKGGEVEYYMDGQSNEPQRKIVEIKFPDKVEISIQSKGGFVIMK